MTSWGQKYGSKTGSEGTEDIYILKNEEGFKTQVVNGFRVLWYIYISKGESSKQKLKNNEF